MRTKVLQLSLAAVAGSFLLTGCINSHRTTVAREPGRPVYPPGEIVVTEPPPEPRTESVGTPPDASHVWVPGYWTYSDQKWVWITGHWEVRPTAGATWVPGRWDKNSTERGWVWTAGHWE